MASPVWLACGVEGRPGVSGGCVLGVVRGSMGVGCVFCFCVSSVWRVCPVRFRLGVLCACRGPVF